ncbi:MAG: ATP-binding cassette domain-containing protein, partial [Ureaplasma sp.]|nr:ATP-binding cassette domain-containing protein [Ureaplasma sp.]
MNKIEELKSLVANNVINIFDIQKKLKISFSALTNLLLDNLIIDKSFDGINNDLLDIKKLRDENNNATKIQSKLSLNYSELSAILLEYYILNGDKVLLDIIQEEIDSDNNSISESLNSKRINNKTYKKDFNTKIIIKNENIEFSDAPLISLDKIDFKVKEKHILSNISFEIKPGTFHAFVGENGAGKSTTIKLLVGLNNKYTGKLLINDVDVRYKENIR